MCIVRDLELSFFDSTHLELHWWICHFGISLSLKSLYEVLIVLLLCRAITNRCQYAYEVDHFQLQVLVYCISIGFRPRSEIIAHAIKGPKNTQPVGFTKAFFCLK